MSELPVSEYVHGINENNWAKSIDIMIGRWNAHYIWNFSISTLVDKT